MKFLFTHLQEFFKEKKSIHDISKSLFHLGHENEYSNNIIDIDFTPNKGDCLSLYGIARDLNALHNANLNIEIYNNDVEKLDFNFTNNIPKFCPKISFLHIEVDVLPDKYEPYFENFFTELNIKKNNFFTDISNYLAYEMGQPTHCYDYHEVKNGITLGNTSSKMPFNTLLSNEITLKKNEQVFFQNDLPINLAGVMGGESTKCDINTKSALIECAYFNPDMIIGKTVYYDIQSDAAYKFERGVDINAQERVLRRFLKIVQEHANITKAKMVNFNYHEHKSLKMPFQYQEINKILGTKLSRAQVTDILLKLGFELTEFVKVPSWRSDIESINDLAEEIARVIGYDNIKNETFSIPSSNKVNFYQSKDNKIREILYSAGFNEVINDPFVPNKNVDCIKVDNPLDKNRKFLRTNLFDSIINNLDYNEKRQKDSIKLYEISNIYLKDKNKIISEKRLTVIISGRVNNNYKEFNKKLDREYLLNIAYILGLNDSYIHQISRDRFKSKVKNKIFVLDCNLNDIKLKENKNKSIRKYNFNEYKKISEYPSINRDISFSINNELALERLLENIFSSNLIDLKESFIFDYYLNEESKVIKIGIRFIFQSNNTTLEDNSILNEMKKIFDIASKIDGVQIPGLQ